MTNTNEPRNVWKGLLWACATWLSHFVILIVLFVTFVICVPAIEFMYDRLNMDLPSITVWFMKFSDNMVAYWYLLVIPLFLDLAFLIVASLSGPKLRWLARAWSTSLLFGTILLLGMTILATSLPFHEFERQQADLAEDAANDHPEAGL
jgi:type II secretory pathway component PulF